MLKLIQFDVRENKETDSREVCWPYSIKSIDISAQKKSILILSESLLADKDGSDKSLLFELSLDLMMATESSAPVSGSKSQQSKNSDGEEISITEAIEEFLAADFEISVDPSSKQNQSRLGMFAPTKLLKPFTGSFFGGQGDQENEREDPYPTRTELQLFQSKSSMRFVATLLHENFTTVKYFDIYEKESNNSATSIIVLAKSHSNQLYRISSELDQGR